MQFIHLSKAVGVPRYQCNYLKSLFKWSGTMEDDIEECIRKKTQWAQLPAPVKKVNYYNVIVLQYQC